MQTYGSLAKQTSQNRFGRQKIEDELGEWVTGGIRGTGILPVTLLDVQQKYCVIDLSLQDDPEEVPHLALRSCRRLDPANPKHASHPKFWLNLFMQQQDRTRQDPG